MHLKRLEMIGFKSFADRSELEFVPGVTAIVGPNGSGKSNVTDGIRWVLGEQSVKLLRGAKMEDVIFSGSETRKPVGYCEVSLTLDNSDHQLNIDFSEVTITRRVYRSGESEYAINRRSCRLKDITELFMDTGIGKEAYSMIGQGRIDDILSTKSEDRRAIFEEAAGIVKYKTRKREAERKLEATEQNLERIRDLISELENTVGPVAEQAEKARRYKELRSRLEQAEVGLYVHKIESLHRNWRTSKEQAEALAHRHMELSTRLNTREAALEELRLRLNRQEEEMGRRQDELLELSENLEKMEARREVLEERIRNREGTRDGIRARIGELEEERDRLKDEWERIQEVCRTKRRELEEAEGNLERLERKLAAAGDEAENQLSQLKSRMHERSAELASLISESRHLKEALDEELRRLSALSGQEKEWMQARARLDEKSDALRREMDQVERELETAADRYRELSRKLEGISADLEAALEELRQIEEEWNRIRSRRDLVKEMEAEHAGFFQGVKEILKAKDRGESELRGVRGAVAQLIRVSAEHEAAVETALGSALQHLVVQDEATARRGIRFLKERRLGRATFLPLEVIQPRELPPAARRQLEGMAGFVGIAADLVDCDAEIQKAVRFLLGNVVVTRTLEDANEAARLLSHRYRVVTLEGDVVHPGGSMTGGSRHSSKTNLLGRSRQLEELSQALARIGERREALYRRREELEQQRADVAKRMDAIREQGERLRLREQELKGSERELAAEHRSLEERIASNRAEQEEARSRRSKLEEELGRLQERRLELEEEQEKAEERIRDLEREVERHVREKGETHRLLTEGKVTVARLTQEVTNLEENAERARREVARTEEQLARSREEEQRMEAEVESLRREIDSLLEQASALGKSKAAAQQRYAEARSERDRLYGEREKSEGEARELRKSLRRREEELRQLEVQVNRLDVELNHLLQKLAEEYELSFELARRRYGVPEDPDAVEGEVQSLRQQIAALGEVNLGAIEEHRRLTERLSYLKEQQQDLVEAKNTLYEVIQNIEQEMARRFSEGFEAIRREFQEVFRHMFGGGRADLYLTEPENPLETGIDIVAQPPGKRLQHLSLLSGGERALAAIALLFAVLRVKPVPFCVLDEVDAALDEANLARFVRYLREFSRNTQFIVITHRKQTMEGADVLYGITMEESGISKLVSVKLEDVAEESAVTANG
ncbi:MAG: chromosome segregation protein SMC [Planifilum sp.]|jgi:chromosome segregation protein